jgi:hypothetical protein
MGVVNNGKVFGAAMETQEWFPFVLLSNRRIFRVAVSNIQLLNFFVYRARYFCPILTKSGGSWTGFRKSLPYQIDLYSSAGSRVDAGGRTDMTY